MSDYEANKVIPGTVYQVIRLLGQGGMGTVYEVEDTTVGKRYVLKTLHAQLRDRKELALRINKEARILARLSHPNIVEVVTAGMTGDGLKLPYFVMQKLNGYTLRAVISAKGFLPAETAYAIAIDLLDALDHAHGLGVIHRDVKPENIFLHRGSNETHQTKLLDFGVMRMLSGDQPQTGARFVGTLRYAPPEQLRGGAITPRTDLYAAGLVLYEMLAGEGPFDDETTDRGIATAHLEKAPPLLSSRAQVSPALEALVMSALAKDPGGRPRDAFTFAARLRELSRAATEARGAGESVSQHGTDEMLLGGIVAPPSETNLDETAPEARHSPLAPSTTKRDAAPPVRDLPRVTLRMDVSPQRPVTAGFDRDAVTVSSPLVDTEGGPGAMASQPLGPAATTTGAISSHVSEVPPRPSSGAAGLAMAAMVGAVVSALVLGARWRAAHAAHASLAPLSSSSSSSSSSAPCASSAPTSPSSAPTAPSAAPAAPVASIAAPAPSASLLPPPALATAIHAPRAPRPTPAPRHTAPPAATVDVPPAKPRLPGPGF